MKIYIPLVCFSVPDEDHDICDFVLQGFQQEADAKILYPEAEILEIDVELPPNPNEN